MRKLLKKFRIRIDPPRKEYYDVLVYSKPEWMRDRFKRVMGPKWSAYGWDAMTCIIDVWDGRKKTPKIGEVLLCTDRLDDEVVAHELTHAVNWYANKRKWNWNIGDRTRGDKNPVWDRYDEKYAMIFGRVISQFWKKWEK